MVTLSVLSAKLATCLCEWLHFSNAFTSIIQLRYYIICPVSPGSTVREREKELELS